MRERVPVRLILAWIWLTFASAAVVLVAFEVRRILFQLVVALFLALVLNRPVAWLTARGMRRGPAIAVVGVLVVVVVVGVAASIAEPLASQGLNLARKAPSYLEQARQGKGPVAQLARRFHLNDQLQRFGPDVSARLSEFSFRLLDVGRRIASTALTTTIVFVLTLFLMAEGPRLVDGIERAIPPRRRRAVERIAAHASQTVGAYTSGILGLALLNGLVTLFALEVMRVPFAVPLATWAGVVDILPIVGGLLGIVPAAMFAFARSIPAGIVVVATMLLYQQIKNHALYPIVVGRAVRLNSLVVLVSVLVGAELAGITGALIAIPVAAIVHVVLVEALGERMPWLRTDTAGRPRAASPRAAVDPLAGTPAPMPPSRPRP